MASRLSTLILGLALAVSACRPAAPFGGVPPAASPTAPPSASGPGLSAAELKYRLLAKFPNLFFCDPDYYPVARANEADLARQRFPDLQADGAEFAAILAHNGLSGLVSFSDDQKLLIYREHKKLGAIQLTAAGGGFEFQLQVSDSPGQGQRIGGQIDGQGAITVQSQQPAIATCPICLAADARIDTPSGPVLVTDLRPGSVVWTLDAAGRRVAEPVLRVGKTVVPPTHRMMHIRLSDGREVWASPGHPAADGRRLGSLRAGDLLDGAVVTLAEGTAYDGAATFDLLPAGDTGFYWANGILLGSTLNGP